MSTEEWMIHTYDSIVASAGTEGITVKEARELAAERYEAAIRSGEIERYELDLFAEGGGIFDRVVRPQRQSRKSSLNRDMETINAALNDETILGSDDPILHIAYPLGTADGRDKVLTLWTREDWRAASMTRYRNAAEVTASAQIFDELSTRIVDRMLTSGVDTTGELFNRREDDLGGDAA